MEEERKLLAIDLGVDCLEHHGILGQKWGIRRFQNEDGSLTEAGKRRYDREVAKEQRVARSIEKSERRMRIKEAKANAKASEMEAKARILEAKARSKKEDAKDASDKANAVGKDVSQKAKLTDEERKERNRKIGMALGIVGGAAAIGFGYKYASDTLKKSGDTEVPDASLLTDFAKSTDKDFVKSEKSSKSKSYTVTSGKDVHKEHENAKASAEKSSNKDNNSGNNNQDNKKKSSGHSDRDKNYAAAKDLEDWIKIAGTGLDFISKISSTYKNVSGGGGK